MDTEKLRDVEIRVAVLEQQHHNFERSAVDFMQRATQQESSIHERLDELVHEVHKIPEMVSTKITESRTQLRTEIDKDHPRRHEVVTPRALMLAATLLAVVLVAGMSVTMIVWDKIEAGHEHAEMQYDSSESE